MGDGPSPMPILGMRHHQNHPPPSINMEKGKGGSYATQCMVSIRECALKTLVSFVPWSREEEIDSRGVEGGKMIYGPAGRRTLQIEAREVQNHTNHGKTSQRLHGIVCIVFFSRCIAKHACALVVKEREERGNHRF